MSIILTEDRATPAHYLISEAASIYRSREQGVVASGSGVVKPGTVMGRILAGAATSAAKAGGNTGNGTLTVDATTPVLAGALPGVYTVRLIAAATNAGTFRVVAPDGTILGDVGVGQTFANRIKFATTDGATDFVVGDGFDITVAAGSGKYVPIAPAGLDGRQVAAAILWQGCDATSVDVRRTFTVRASEVAANALIWPVGMTDPQKTAAMAALAALGIHGR